VRGWRERVEYMERAKLAWLGVEREAQWEWRDDMIGCRRDMEMEEDRDLMVRASQSS
jgi:hypothetical protein